MRFIALLLSFLFALEVSQAIPIWLSGVTQPPGSSSKAPARLIEKQLTPEQLAEKEFKDKRMDEYLNSVLINLFDQHDIVPEEHEWDGPKRPFNLDEYFRIRTPKIRSKIPWKRIWNRLLDLFSSDDPDAFAGAKTTFAEEGSEKIDSQLLIENPESDADSQNPDRIWDATFGPDRMSDEDNEPRGSDNR
ncbi:hypothetical protein HOY82DRAFT_612850 [Tuber indicum]|nr:hypothetical protein HOY82DRAFT_612850 [Tuber indicum]